MKTIPFDYQKFKDGKAAYYEGAKVIHAVQCSTCPDEFGIIYDRNGMIYGTTVTAYALNMEAETRHMVVVEHSHGYEAAYPFKQKEDADHFAEGCGGRVIAQMEVTLD